MSLKKKRSNKVGKAASQRASAAYVEALSSGLEEGKTQKAGQEPNSYLKVAQLMLLRGHLTPWEENFISSLDNQLFKGRSLSRLQAISLSKIWERFN